MCCISSRANDDRIFHAYNVLCPEREREAQISSRLINESNQRYVSYLIDTDLPTRLEKVIDITPASRHGQLRLREHVNISILAHEVYHEMTGI
jgi:hypothetical protein